VVDEYIDAAVPAAYLGHEFPDRVGIGAVSNYRFRASSRRDDGVADFATFRGNVNHDHMRPVARKALADGTTDPASATCYKRDLALKNLAHVTASFVSSASKSA